MKWIAVPALLAAFVAFDGPASAEPLGGCWHYSDGTVFSTVCLQGAQRGTFNLEYAAADPQAGLVKGSCNGIIEIQEISETTVSFTVPYQEGACRQEDQVFRVARRDYRCSVVEGRPALTCALTVFYDNGDVYSRAEGLEYRR